MHQKYLFDLHVIQIITGLSKLSVQRKIDVICWHQGEADEPVEEADSDTENKVV